MTKELKATKEAKGLVMIKLFLKEATENNIDKKMEEASMKIEINLHHDKDNVHRLELEISSAKIIAEAAKQQQESIIPPPPSELEE